MNKKIYIAALACLSLMGLTSCESWLDEEVRSSMTGNDFNKTETQISEQVTRLYRRGAPSELSGAGSAYMGPVSTLPGMLTGYFRNEYEGQEQTCRYSRNLERQNNTNTVSQSFESLYYYSYSAINIANSVLAYAPDIKMDDSSRNQYIGEAKFFRAFNYFTLVKYFGDVPLSTTPYEEPNNLELAKSSTSEVYAQIESDLTDAVSKLPAVKFCKNGYRVGKYAAQMLLTAVYMQEGKYSEAATVAKDLIANSGHALATNDNLGTGSAYNKLRQNDDLDEVIYSYEYNSTISTSSWWPSYSFDSQAEGLFKSYSIFRNIYGASSRYLNVYEAKDLRIQPNQFFHWTYTFPTADKVSVEAGTVITDENDEAWNWYWYDENALLTTGQGTKDFNFFRFSEALLDAAEAIAQSSGVTAEAAGYLAQVQARANMEGKTASEIAAELQKLSKDDFIHTCWTERLREFPLEFKIWDDCTRTGKFPNISSTTKGQVTYVDLVGATNGSGATFKQTDLLWPFPLTELQRNSLLVQNDGYATQQ